MNEIAKNPEFDRLISSIQELETELADLVFERDKLRYHVCPKLQAEYMLKIGKLEYAVFEYQCKILRTKRKIEIIQSYKNREQSFDVAAIEKQLDKEYQEYTDKLLEKQKEIENARLKNGSYGKQLTVEESAELKKLYTLVVKKLHPDINHDSTPEQHDQFIDEEIKLESKLRFVREPDNRHDTLAILVKDQNGNKLGYVPREKNPVLARLMDAGKNIYGTVKKIDNDDDYMDVEMEIFMDD